MTAQKNSENSGKSINKKDISTYTAYGDPIIDTKPTINNQHVKASSPIADSTQSVSSGGSIKPDTNKQDTVTYGDPIKDDSTFKPDEYKQGNSTIAKSTST